VPHSGQVTGRDAVPQQILFGHVFAFIIRRIHDFVVQVLVKQQGKQLKLM
jgi:hypothetical protein